jgi:protein TonB
VTPPLDGLTRLGDGLDRDHPWLAAALLASAGLHLFAGLLFPRPAPTAPRAARPPTDFIDVETAPPPPQPVVDAPPPPAPAAARAQPHRGQKVLAQAGQIVARAPAPAEPLDFTDDVVTGSGSTFAGGTTAASGASRSVVRSAAGPPAPDVGAGGTGSGANLSRSPSMADDSSWRCPFPPEASGIDEANVQLRVFVGADGKALDVAVIADPGHGFGPEAVRCALGKRWNPALDRAGNPIRATAIVKVRFTR